MGTVGLHFLPSTGTFSIVSRVACPSITCAKTVYCPSRCRALAYVMKNCDLCGGEWRAEPWGKQGCRQKKSHNVRKSVERQAKLPRPLPGSHALVGVLAAVGHGDHPALVVPQLWHDLVCERAAPHALAALARAGGVTSLHHEALAQHRGDGGSESPAARVSGGKQRGTASTRAHGAQRSLHLALAAALSGATGRACAAHARSR